MSATRVLFLPLSNVLGHLTRTFAFAEKLHELNLEVHIATCDHYKTLFEVLPKGITLHDSIEMPASSSRAFGKIMSYDSGGQHDLANLNSASNLSSVEMQIRSDFLRKMVDQDEQLIAHLNPEIIITDYRYTILNMNLPAETRVFHLSNLLGFPSFFKRVRGQLFAPLDEERVLVPGLQFLEDPQDEYAKENARIQWCGHFQWSGWKRLNGKHQKLNNADIFLSFGSTGNALDLIPWMVENIASKHSLIATIDKDQNALKRENLQVVQFGNLEQCLSKSRIVCCHGGHGTIMESILHQTPMMIFPNNLEQLEIGRQIERSGLGILIDRPIEEISKNDLNTSLERLLNDDQIKTKLAHFAELIRKKDGPKRASEIILNK